MRAVWLVTGLLTLTMGAAQEPATGPVDQVQGHLLQLVENGGWCWYQDKRALLDATGGKLLVATVGNALGFDGKARDADIDVTTLDLASGARTRITMRKLPSYGGGDDHNAAALWLRPDGRYLAVYAGHNDASRNSYYRISEQPHDGSRWQPEQAFNWGVHLPGTKSNVTYSNLFYLSAERRLYNLAREDQRSPNLAWSEDGGTTWRYGGKLTLPSRPVAYSNGYLRYAGDGERIDFIATEHHPRDFNNSIFHGYLRGGKTHDSTGKVLDESVADERAPAPEQFTPIFRAAAEDSQDDEREYHRAWTVDLDYWAPGKPHALFITRYGTVTWPAGARRTPQNSGAADHRLFYARFDGAAWRVVELCKMGRPLYPPEQDYTGLGALDPDAPDTLFVATHIDPRDGRELARREIFRGRSADAGATWSWTPVTWNSTLDNCRPVVPRWGGGRRALLWWRGRYDSQRSYDTALVGLLERGEAAGQLTYVDAGAANTTRADGQPLTATGPSAERGPTDDGWHQRGGEGNGGGVLTAGELGAEDAPRLKTTLTLPAAGTYDLWVCFWSNPAQDWRVAAGLSPESLLVYRRQGAQHTPATQFTAPVSVEGPTTALYRAWLGRVRTTGAQPVSVWVDDVPGATADGARRTWYDGVAYAAAEPGR